MGKLLITLRYLQGTLIWLYLLHVCQSLVFNLVMTSLFKWEISFKMFSVKSFFQLQILGLCLSNPNDNVSISLDES